MRVAGTFDWTSFDKADAETPGKTTITQCSAALSECTRQAIIQSVAINSTAFEDQDDGKATFVASKAETALLQLDHDHLGMSALTHTRERGNYPDVPLRL